MSINPDLPVVYGTGGSPGYSDKVRREILAALKIGCTRTAAYGAAGISEQTFYRWMKTDGSFREGVEQAEAHAERIYTRRLAVKAAAGDERAIEFWLSRRRGANWREKTTVEVVPSIEDEVDESLNDEYVDSRLLALAGDAHRRRASRAGGSTDDGAGPPEGAGEPRSGERVPVQDGAAGPR